jgi:cytochrome oxidase Cu insertion factor (SCO1/SenC/PrrC family)
MFARYARAVLTNRHRLAVRAAAAALAFAGLALGGTARAATDAAHRPLVDQLGAHFRIADLRGKPVAVTFVASRCTDACPIANAQFARLQERLAHGHIAATLLTVTLDPAYDTPFVMAAQAHQYGADGRVWRLASGAPSDVRAVMRGFNVTAAASGKGVPEVHSSFVYILSAQGKLARTLLLSTNLPDEATAALRDRAVK